MWYLKSFLAKKVHSPVEIFCGLCVFAAAAFGASVHHVVSTVLALLFITSLFYIRTWHQAWGRLSRNEYFVLTGFFVFTLSCLLAYNNVEDDSEYIKHAGRYIRFTMIVPVYLLLVKYDIRVYKYFIAGVIVSGPIFLLTAYMSMQDFSNVRWKPEYGVSGQYYRILFGNIAALNIIIMAVYAVVEKNTLIVRFVIALSIFCALYASVLSAARSGWIALVLCMLLLLYAIAKKRHYIKTVAITFVLLLLVTWFSPARLIIIDRIDAAVYEINNYANNKQYNTPVGTRLALWDVALKVWLEHPVIGSGPGDFDEDLTGIQEQGLYRKVDVHSNVHSNYFQSLATTGLVGFLALIFSLVILPYLFFSKMRDQQSRVVGLMGMYFIISFAIFGLTEAWILRAPFMSMFLAYYVSLSSSAPRAPV